MPLRLRQLTRFPTLSLILITGFGVAGGLYILARKTFFVPEVRIHMFIALVVFTIVFEKIWKRKEVRFIVFEKLGEKPRIVEPGSQ